MNFISPFSIYSKNSKFGANSVYLFSYQAFYPINMPSLSYLNLRGNPLDRDSVEDLLKVLRGFTCLQALEVSITTPTFYVVM